MPSKKSKELLELIEFVFDHYGLNMGADTHSNIHRAYKANDTKSLQIELESLK